MAMDKKASDELDEILSGLGREVSHEQSSRVNLDSANSSQGGAYVNLDFSGSHKESPETPSQEATDLSFDNTAFASMSFQESEDDDVTIYSPEWSSHSDDEEDGDLDQGATQLLPDLSEMKEDGEEPEQGSDKKSQKNKKARRERKRKVKEIPPEDLEESSEEDVKEYQKMVRGEVWGCLRTVFYVILVVALSLALAFYIIRAGLDFTGIGRDENKKNVMIPEGSSTQQIAEVLEANGIIQEPFIFRVYCRIMGEDGTFHPGLHVVSASMGYDGVVTELQKVEIRETVQVTIPEGTTVENIIEILEENNVCEAKDFYAAMANIDFGASYDFIAELTEAERQNRVYLLEGYLFPDTYSFYQDGAAETVIRTMLDNFASRVDADTRAAIKQSGKTLNEVLIQASIIQMEAGFKEDMPRVARVTQNRLNNPSEFPLLQMDSTRDYLSNLTEASDVSGVMDTYYNTYVREGLPVGSICNPGLDAINAALNPSTEENIINCVYFASIVDTGETQFFETFAEHEAWCTEHGVGMYG